MSAKIRYDKEGCEGFWVCTAADPRFKEDAEANKAILEGAKEIEPGLYELEIDEDIDLAEQAADGCPVDVINVLGEDGDVIAGPEELPIEQ